VGTNEAVFFLRLESLPKEGRSFSNSPSSLSSSSSAAASASFPAFIPATAVVLASASESAPNHAVATDLSSEMLGRSGKIPSSLPESEGASATEELVGNSRYWTSAAAACWAASDAIFCAAAVASAALALAAAAASAAAFL
jgi:hypothetical protein